MRKKYDLIHEGMTIAEVSAIMEANPSAELIRVDEDWYFDIWVWQSAGYRIQVEFTQPPERAGELAPLSAVATDGIGKVRFKELRSSTDDFQERATKFLERLRNSFLDDS